MGKPLVTKTQKIAERFFVFFLEKKKTPHECGVSGNKRGN
jgi:hypothetical protein